MAFNVLIVDDSCTMRAVIKKALKMSGFDVGQYLEAADGLEAISVLKRHWIDLILADINMPNMDGIELLKTLHRDELLRDIRVVMVTTEGSHQRVEQAQSMGAAGYIKKPFTPRDLKDTLNRVMGEPCDGSVADLGENEGCDF